MPIIKADWNKPALAVVGGEFVIVAGTRFGGVSFDKATPVAMPKNLTAGDYRVTVQDGVATAALLAAAPDLGDPATIGGFHLAPGGNAAARAGGDESPAINPCSLWDIAFRPACADPRGMACIDSLRAPFWTDIYLLGVNHLTDGTSRLGVEIADGNSPPQNPSGGAFDELDYATAVAVMKHHGKGLLSIEEFFAAAFGVTEKTSHKVDPKVTKLDAARTSKFGLMQATGNLWVWGHDGDPDAPRPSLFGGSWWDDGFAGSRQADVDVWAGYSCGDLGARGRSDHLQLV